MIERGATKEQILQVVEHCFCIDYHRQQFLKKEMRYLEWEWPLLVHAASQVYNNARREAAKPWQRTVSEVMRHEYTHTFRTRWGRLPSDSEISAEYERIINRLHRENPGSFSDPLDYNCPVVGCDWGTMNIHKHKPRPVPHDASLEAIKKLVEAELSDG